MKETPDPSVVQALFVAEVRGCEKLKRECDEYFLSDAGSEKKAYEYLYQSAKKVVAAERKAFVRQSETGTHVPALAAEDGGKGKGKKGRGKGGRRSRSCTKGAGKGKQQDNPPVGDLLCWFFAAGSCRNGTQCRFSHDAATAKGKARDPSRPRSASQGSDTGKANRGQRTTQAMACKNFDGSSNSCLNGDNCQYSHDGWTKVTRKKDKKNKKERKSSRERSTSPAASEKPRKSRRGSRGRSPTPKGETNATVAAPKKGADSEASSGDEDSGDESSSSS